VKVEPMIRIEPGHAVNAKSSQICTQNDPLVTEVQVDYPNYDDNKDEESYHDDGNDDDNDNKYKNEDNNGNEDDNDQDEDDEDDEDNDNHNVQAVLKPFWESITLCFFP